MKLLFVHIPKTGGTSIRSVIQDNWNRKWPMGHDPYFELEKMNQIHKDVFSFTVVRNPFTRAFSYYKHYLMQNNSKDSFEDFLYLVRIKRGTRNTPMILYNQSFYTHNLNGKCKLKKVYKFEKLNKLEDDLNITLPKLRVGKYDQEEYLKTYNKDNINLVKHIYLEDFCNFNYSLDFDNVFS